MNINATLHPDNPEANFETDSKSGSVESQAAVSAVVVGGARQGLTFRITEEQETRLLESGEERIL